MARMYKSRKGQSGSTRPHVSEAPEWSNTDKAAVTATILDLAKSGKSSSEIGMILRDKHAVPNVRLVLGMRLGHDPTSSPQGEVLATIEHVVARAHAHGRVAGIYCADARTAQKMAERGMDLVVIGSDLGWVAGGVMDALRELR